MPGRGQRPGLGLAIADDDRDEQVRIIEGGAEGVRDAVPELAPSWIEPGVSGVQWLPMPPGKENSLKNARMPSSSSLLFG